MQEELLGIQVAQDLFVRFVFLLFISSVFLKTNPVVVTWLALHSVRAWSVSCTEHVFVGQDFGSAVATGSCAGPAAASGWSCSSRATTLGTAPGTTRRPDFPPAAHISLSSRPAATCLGFSHPVVSPGWLCQWTEAALLAWRSAHVSNAPRLAKAARLVARGSLVFMCTCSLST